MTLEIHESTVTEPAEMRALQAELKALNIKLAYDDFGAGQARLLELVEVPPDYLKFDRSLIEAIDVAPSQRQQMLATLIRMVCDLGIISLAEGVETPGEGEVCRELGFELGQGFLWGHPEGPSTWKLRR
jgi:EAL domain-containing protein (putative c-di-GMP-specific phosphodiesterase class I)